MSRRKAATKREILPDSKYHNLVVAKCINVVMWDGKKEVAENIVYGAMEKLKTIAKDKDELTTFLEAVDALKPSVEVKGRRVGGATYQVPVEVRPARQQTMALRWLVMFARKRGERSPFCIRKQAPLFRVRCAVYRRRSAKGPARIYRRRIRLFLRSQNRRQNYDLYQYP